MRILLSFLLLLSSSVSFASGKLTYKNSWDVKTKEPSYVLGLAVNQPAALGLSYIGWFGGGQKALDNYWMKMDNAMEGYALGASIAVGVESEMQVPEDLMHSVYLKVGVTLW